jgi:hypothetical protein
MVMVAAVAVSTAPVATAVVRDRQAPSALAASESLPSYRAVFPVTMTRMGGFAGFQDVLVMTREGLVLVTDRGESRQCQLTPAATQRLRTAASQVPWARITPDDGQARFPDDMVVMVKSPAGGPVRVENPRVGAAGVVFQELLADITSGQAASSMCQAA